MRGCAYLFSLVRTPIVFVYSKVQGVLSSRLLEKKQPSSAVDFETIVLKEMEDIIYDPVWDSFNKQSISDFEQEAQQTEENFIDSQLSFTQEKIVSMPLKKEEPKKEAPKKGFFFGKTRCWVLRINNPYPCHPCRPYHPCRLAYHQPPQGLLAQAFQQPWLLW